MEIAILTILSVLAFLGASYIISYIFCICKSRYSDKGIRLVLCLPRDFSPKIEGVVRQIFSEGIPKSLMTDGKIYFMVSSQDAETVRILGELRRMYPVEVLPEEVSYCMITEKEKT